MKSMSAIIFKDIVIEMRNKESITSMLMFGVLVLVVFQLITLPVEFDASRRAKIILREMGIVQPGQEAAGVNSVLNAAALTYVAAFIAALGNLLWLMSLRDRR